MAKVKEVYKKGRRRVKLLTATSSDVYSQADRTRERTLFGETPLCRNPIRLMKPQSWTKVLTHLSKTNAFCRRSSVILKRIFFVNSSTPSPSFQCCNTLRGHCDLVTTLKRGDGVEMSKLGIEKLTLLTKQVFFGECLNYFCP